MHHCSEPVTEAKYKKAPTFKEFVSFLVNTPVTQWQDMICQICIMVCVQVSEYDPHWRPMYVQCLPCHISYSVIARMESLGRDSQYVLQTIGAGNTEWGDTQLVVSSHDISTSDWRCPTRRGPAAARRWTWSRSSSPSWVGSGHSARYSLILLISDDQLLQKLADIYKFDFLLFDYSFEDFKEQLRNGVSNNNAR